MRAFRKTLKTECDAVSEVVGLVLMVAIATVALSGTAAVVFSSSGPDQAPHIDLWEWVDTNSDVLYVKHEGGDLIDVEELELVVNVNGARYIFSSSELSEGLGKNTWGPGDVFTVDMRKKWGLCLENGDSLDMYMVFRDSKEVMQKASIPLDGMCRPVMHLNTWYFFTRVDGEGSDEVNLEFLKDYDPTIEITSISDEDEHDRDLGKNTGNVNGNDKDNGKDKDNGNDKDNGKEEYFPNNPVFIDLFKNYLDLTFGFNDEDFKGFKSPPETVTVLIIYNFQDRPTNENMNLYNREMPDFNPHDSGNPHWYLYNQTIEVENLHRVSDLEFNLQAEANGNKDISIDYLAIRLN